MGGVMLEHARRLLQPNAVYERLRAKGKIRMGVMPGANPYHRFGPSEAERMMLNEQAYLEAARKRQDELWQEWRAEQEEAKQQASKGLLARLKRWLFPAHA